MANRNKQEAIEFYEAQTESKRDELQAKFGNEGVADRESKFYKWLQTYNDSEKVIKHFQSDEPEHDGIKFFQDDDERGDSHDGGIKHFQD